MAKPRQYVKYSSQKSDFKAYKQSALLGIEGAKSACHSYLDPGIGEALDYLRLKKLGGSNIVCVVDLQNGEGESCAVAEFSTFQPVCS